MHAVLVTRSFRRPREVAVVRDEPERPAAHRPANVVSDPLIPPEVPDARRVRVGAVEGELLPDERLELDPRGCAPEHARDEVVGERVWWRKLGVRIRLPDDGLGERSPDGR